MTEAEDWHLIGRFRAFQAELAAQMAFPDAGAPEDGAAGDAARRAFERLAGVLEAQAAEDDSDLPPEERGQAQYVMAAWADEILLHRPWPGRDGWSQHRLEARLFASRLADREVFRRIERLLAERRRRRPGLAAVMLLALGLGFAGAYRGRGDGRTLAGYRQRLYEYAFGRPVERAPTAPLTPDAYVAPAGRGLYRRRRGGGWAVALAVILAGWLVVGTLAWREVTAPLVAALGG